MSLEYCARCKKEFLTEADDYVVMPREGYALNCGCVYTEDANNKLLAMNKKLVQVVAIAKELMEFYGRLGNHNLKNAFGSDIGFGNSPMDDAEKIRKDKPVAYGKLARRKWVELDEILKGEE
jgi:hypothetical protein